MTKTLTSLFMNLAIISACISANQPPKVIVDLSARPEANLLTKYDQYNHTIQERAEIRHKMIILLENVNFYSGKEVSLLTDAINDFILNNDQLESYINIDASIKKSLKPAIDNLNKTIEEFRHKHIENFVIHEYRVEHLKIIRPLIDQFLKISDSYLKNPSPFSAEEGISLTDVKFAFVWNDNTPDEDLSIFIKKCTLKLVVNKPNVPVYTRLYYVVDNMRHIDQSMLKAKPTIPAKVYHEVFIRQEFNKGRSLIDEQAYTKGAAVEAIINSDCTIFVDQNDNRLLQIVYANKNAFI